MDLNPSPPPFTEREEHLSPKRREAQTMDRAGTVLFERAKVRAGAVAFMSIKTVDREFLMIFYHQSIARDFGDNGSGGAGPNFFIPAHHGFLAKR